MITEDLRQIAFMIEDSRRCGVTEGRKQVIDNPEKYGLQKPADWSEEDDVMFKTAKKIIWESEASDGTTNKVISWLENRFKSLRPQPKQKPADWSEEDGAILDSVIRIITQFDDLAHEPTFAGPKWTHPYTKELNFLKKLRNRLFEEND